MSSRQSRTRGNRRTRRRQNQLNETTGKRELQKLINFIGQHGYTYDSINEAETSGYYIANFMKPIQYTDAQGEWINDRHIKVTIEFDDDFDYKNIQPRGDDSPVYNDYKGAEFVQNLIDKSY